MRNGGPLALLMVTLAGQGAARAGGDERDPAFVADRLRRAIQKEISRAKVSTPEPMAMDVEIDGKTIRLGLDNLVRRCAAPPECDAMIASLVESLKQTSGFGSERIVALRRLASVILEEDSHPLTTTLPEWTPTGFRVWNSTSRDGGP